MREGCRFPLLLVLLGLLLVTGQAAQEQTGKATDSNTSEKTEERIREVKAMVELMHRDNPDSPLRMVGMDETNYYVVWARRDALRIAEMKSREEMARRRIENREIKTETVPEWEFPLSTSRGGQYVVDLLLGGSAGGPAHSQMVIIDTGSDLTWVQCQPCQDCLPQSDPIYQPLKGDTFSKISCQDWTNGRMQEHRWMGFG